MPRRPLTEIIGTVADARCREVPLAESDGSEYITQVINITIQDVESGLRYYCELHSEDIQVLTGIRRELTPLEMIRYAEALSTSEAKFPLLVDTNETFVTPEMIILGPAAPKPKRRGNTVNGFNKEEIKRSKTTKNHVPIQLENDDR